MAVVTAVGEGRPEGRGEQALVDVAALFAEHAATVRRLVRFGVRAPEPLIEDACQVAWGCLLVHRRQVRRDGALAWVVRTGIREALRVMRRDRTTVPLAALCDDEDDDEAGGGDCVIAVGAAPAPDEIVEARVRLDAIRALPARQQRLVWMQAAGFSYAEMSQRTGATPRTVERQILRARRRLKAES